MKKNKYINQLVSVGLTPREAKIYLGLLTKNSFTATEIAKVSGIPRQKIYELLDNLVKKGICIEKAGRVKRYQAVNPESVFSGLIEEYKEKESVAKELSENLSSIFNENIEKDEPLDYIEIIKNNDQLKKRWLEIDHNIEEEALTFMKPPFITPIEDAIDDEVEIRKDDADRKSLKCLHICEYKDIKTQAELNDFIKLINNIMTLGGEIRIVEELPMKLVIYDKKITILNFDDLISLKPSITTMIITHPNFARSMSYLFYSVWKEGLTLDEFKQKADTLIKF